jgi:cytochrome c peroxidase
MWDGNVPHLDMQSLFPITHPAEMGENFQHVVMKLQRSQVYRKLYQKAWNESVITGETTLKSLSAFMLSLISNNSKYDSVMRGETNFSSMESRGYKLFSKNCNSCHKEPLFSTYGYENNGMAMNIFLNDAGRFQVTGNRNDSLKFKVPTLRNIEYTYPYMHDGRFRRLAEVLNHYTDGIVQSATLSPPLRKGIRLNADEKTELTAFLLTLSDHSFLFNPEYGYPHQLLNQAVTHNKRP